MWGLKVSKLGVQSNLKIFGFPNHGDTLNFHKDVDLKKDSFTEEDNRFGLGGRYRMALKISRCRWMLTWHLSWSLA